MNEIITTETLRDYQFSLGKFDLNPSSSAQSSLSSPSQILGENLQNLDHFAADFSLFRGQFIPKA